MTWGYSERNIIKIGPSGRSDRPIEVVMPSTTHLTVDQAYRIGKALIHAAQMAFEEEDSR